jgi:hypothetical protein
LISENAFLTEELRAIRSSTVAEKVCFDSLVFKKANIRNYYEFEGADDIPAMSLNELVNSFDPSSTRREQLALKILRRFIKHLFENVS